ncbi:protein involved in cellulose biosynthesis (CelD)-like protein [Hyphomicrobium denitrificans 1NES1]|uniref:Protein involved in cellulose biosynthesis (CelD)-like protein n=1 Tax=Hyphomicrobium denitrificans 1NES1 TaxID=670307 RepID=N0BC23_9HYPH|nr:GNAT family N-acetyltransferase [Hyphomicrobium denitrificans]AGK57685.1 protein involved in cellulose biosynthesis (CelD)-like protein [Hyphomicrobium denitrificans 1NES1]
MHAAARSVSSLNLEKPAKTAPRALGRESIEPRLDLNLITERSAFDALEPEWNALFERAARSIHVFQSFNVCWHWANHFLAQESGKSAPRLAILTGRRNGRLIMIWPLVSERMHGVTQTYWMGEPLSQYGDALIDTDFDAVETLRAGLEFLRKNLSSDVLRLRRVRADANIAPLMAEIGAQVADEQIAPYMDLASAKDFATFEERFSAKMRRNRRRLIKRLEEKGLVEFLRLRGGTEAGELAAKAIAVKSLWLKDRGLVSSALNDKRTVRLFQDLAEGRDKKVPCVVSILKTCGQAAAFEISFTCKGRLVVHVMAFELAHEKAGVGVLLLEQNLKAGYEEKLAVYDMMAPGDAYKLDWCDESEPVVDWVKPLSAKGYLYARVYLGFLRTRLKSTLKSMPKPLRRLMRQGLGSASVPS